jgi:hypothetical protein
VDTDGVLMKQQVKVSLHQERFSLLCQSGAAEPSRANLSEQARVIKLCTVLTTARKFATAKQVLTRVVALVWRRGGEGI